MTDMFDRLEWAYRAVFTQTNAGGGTVLAKFQANERTVILYGVFGPDDYAADRTVEIYMEDSAGNKLGRVLFGSPFDNELVPFPLDAVTTVLANAGNQFYNRIVLGKGDQLIVKAVTLVQNETLTVNLRALIRSWPPTVVTTGSGGTVTTTVTYNKVI